MSSIQSIQLSHPPAMEGPHAHCTSNTCGYYDLLCTYLPPFPRTVTLAYLGDEKGHCFQLCNAQVPFHLIPFPAELHSGWKKSQCTEEAIRDLIIEKMMMVAADAMRRSRAFKYNFEILDQGFWYPHEFFENLKIAQNLEKLNSFQENEHFFGIPPEGFFQISNSDFPTGKDVLGYQLMQGILPNQGLINVRKTLCFLDCQEGIQLAHYEALLEILGETKFNALFSADGNFPLRFNPRMRNSLLLEFFPIQQITAFGSVGARPIQPGDAIYFKNLSWYPLKHPLGEWTGFHVVCIQNEPVQKFVGFGTGTTPDGFTEEQIYDLFTEALNKKAIAAHELFKDDLAKTMTSIFEQALSPLEPLMTENIDQGVISALIQKNPGKIGLRPAVYSPNLQAFQKIMEIA